MTQLGDYPPWERLHRLYDLPNPPSATIFSFRKGAQHRSWLPDFSASPDPVHELHQFVDNVIWPVISSATYIQLKIGLGLIACLMALVIAIMIRKIRQRSFWIFHRLVRPTGTFILPNSLVVFSLFELIFAACLFIGNSFIIFLVAPRIEQYYVYFTFAWIWYPLCVGATLSTIGLVCARPNAFASLTPQRGKPPSLALRLGITPTLVNWFLLVLVPISIGLGIAVPSAQHEAKFLRTVHLWHQFGKDWNSPTTTTTELSREMLIDAQRVWYTFLESMYHVSTCLIVYSAWALLILLLTLAAYMPLIWMLFKQIRSYILDVRRSKSTSASNQAETQGKAKFTVRNMISRCSQVLGSSPPSSSDVEAQESAVQVTSMYFTEQEIRDQNTPSRNFFPAVKPSAFDRVRPGLDAERSKEEHVLKLFKSTFVQVCGLLGTIVIFFSLAVWAAMSFYSEAESNTEGVTVTKGLLTANYATCIGLGVVSLSLFFRTFDYTTMAPPGGAKAKLKPSPGSSALSTLPPGHIVRPRSSSPAFDQAVCKELPLVVIERTYDIEDVKSTDQVSMDKLSTRT